MGAIQFFRDMAEAAGKPLEQFVQAAAKCEPTKALEPTAKPEEPATAAKPEEPTEAAATAEPKAAAATAEPKAAAVEPPKTGAEAKSKAGARK